jgi:hypothetical protein
VKFLHIHNSVRGDSGACGGAVCGRFLVLSLVWGGTLSERGMFKLAKLLFLILVLGTDWCSSVNLHMCNTQDTCQNFDAAVWTSTCGTHRTPVRTVDAAVWTYTCVTHRTPVRTVDAAVWTNTRVTHRKPVRTVDAAVWTYTRVTHRKPVRTITEVKVTPGHVCADRRNTEL